ncbi:unnamed protein product [Chrysoparadoxa australica]
MKAGAKTLPQHEQERLSHLWRAAHISLVTCPALSLNYARMWRKQAHQYIDTSTLKGLCKGCGSLLVPGVTCRVRIRTRSIHSPCVKAAGKKSLSRFKQEAPGKAGQQSSNHSSHKSKSKPPKCKNQLVTTCLSCSTIARDPGAVRAKPSKKDVAAVNAGEKRRARNRRKRGRTAKSHEKPPEDFISLVRALGGAKGKAERLPATATKTASKPAPQGGAPSLLDKLEAARKGKRKKQKRGK